MDGETVLSLQTWVRRARAGDLAAFGKLVENTERMVCSVSRRVLGDSAEVSDAVQEAYLCAFKKLVDLRDDAAFPTWMRRIAIRCACDLRRRRRGTFLQIDEAESVPVLDETETRWSPSQRAALSAALLGLNPEDRRICNRHYHWGWSVARLAADAVIHEAAMRKRLQRVRDRLRRKIEMQEQEQFDDQRQPGGLPAKIVELLARPSLVDVPENPVGRVLELLQAQFDGFTLVETPEIIDLRQARSAMKFDPVYIDARAVQHIDADKILRYDLSLPLLLTVRSQDRPLRALSAGKVYRNDGVSRTHLEAFHQFEVLEMDEASDVDCWTFASRILRSIETVLPRRSIRIMPTEYPMCSKAWELSVETSGTWTEALAWGVYTPRVVEFLGGDPAKHVALGAGCGLERIACIAFGIDDIRRIELATVAGD